MPTGVPTHHARQGRMSPLTRTRLAESLPARRPRPLPVDPIRTFGRAGRFVVEIGSGQGDSAIAYAGAHPGADLLAIEVQLTGVARTAAAAHAAGLTNLWIEPADALDFLARHTGSRSIDEIQLFFPDPWPKARHRKRRIVRGSVLDLFHDRLATGGVVVFATDHDAMWQHSLGEVRRHGGFDAVPVARPAWRPVRGFEERALAEGRAPRYLELRPRGVGSARTEQEG